ncbi:MAG: hypothetical protein V1770_05070 [bacterium]
MYLFINTCLENKIVFALKEKNVIIKKEFSVKNRQMEKIIGILDKFLNNNKIALEKISAIIGVTGTGKFTAARLGVSIANALSYSLAIPSEGLRLGEFESIAEAFTIGEKKLKNKKSGLLCPFYDKEPNITATKSQNQ